MSSGLEMDQICRAPCEEELGVTSIRSAEAVLCLMTSTERPKAARKERAYDMLSLSWQSIARWARVTGRVCEWVWVAEADGGA